MRPDPDPTPDPAWERFVASLDPATLERERYRQPDPSEDFHSPESRRQRERHAVLAELISALNAGTISLYEFRLAIHDHRHPHTHHGDRP